MITVEHRVISYYNYTSQTMIKVLARDIILVITKRFKDITDVVRNTIKSEDRKLSRKKAATNQSVLRSIRNVVYISKGM